MCPFSHNAASCCSDSASNRNNVRNSSGRHLCSVSPINSFSLRLRQIAVYQHHGHRPFAEGGCHSFGGLGTHISCNKHTRHTCFQVVRRTVQRPADDVAKVRPGQDEFVLVAGHNPIEPLCPRFC